MGVVEVKLCEADGCSRPVDPEKQATARYCSNRCRKRTNERRRTGAMPSRSCANCGKPMGRVPKNQRCCDRRCSYWLREGLGVPPPIEPPLSEYWREYLRRFDRAIRERTPAAWAAAHEMAPTGSGDPGHLAAGEPGIADDSAWAAVFGLLEE